MSCDGTVSLLGLRHPHVCCYSIPLNIIQMLLDPSIFTQIQILHIMGSNGFLIWQCVATFKCFNHMFKARVVNGVKWHHILCYEVAYSICQFLPSRAVFINQLLCFKHRRQLLLYSPRVHWYGFTATRRGLTGTAFPLRQTRFFSFSIAANSAECALLT